LTAKTCGVHRLLRGKHAGIPFNEHSTADGAIIYRHACALGCEGIVSKRLGSAYRSGRADCRVKVKNPAAPAVTREAEKDWDRRRGLRSPDPHRSVRRIMINLLAEAINSEDPDRAAKLIQDALGIESDDVVNYCFPKTWPADHEQRARILGTWLTTEARYLAS
jgi:hypothetical protein